MAFYNKSFTIDDLSDLMIASDATIHSNIVSAKKMLSAHFPDLTIKQNQYTNISLIGSEESRRNLISGLLSHNTDRKILRRYLGYIFDTDELYEKIIYLIDFISEILEDNGYYLSGQGLYSFSIDIALTFARIDMNCLVTDSDLNFENINPAFFPNFIQNIEKYYHKSLPINECEYIKGRFFAKQFSSKTNISTFSNDKILKIITLFLDRIYIKFNIDFRADTSLIDNLQLHMSSTIRLLKKEHYSENPIKYLVRNENPFLTVLALEMAFVVKEQLGLIMKLSEISYVALYLLSTFNRLKNKNKVLVVCDYGDSIKSLLLSNINEFFSGNIQVADVCTSHKLKHCFFEHTDISFIISSVNISSILETELSIPIIQVSPIITELEKQLIEKTTYYYSTKNTLLSNNSLCFFDSSLFIIKEKNVSFDDLINDLIELQLETKIIKNAKNYLSQLLTIGEFFYSIFKNKNNILILQPYFHIGDHTKITTAILKEPVFYIDSSINIIFLISINPNEIDKLPNLYNTISLIINSKKCDKLLNVSNFNDYIKIIDEILYK